MPIESSLDVTVELPWQAFFPADYLPGERFRIDTYRRMGRLKKLADLEEFRTELSDRFGPLPEVALNLLRLTELRILAQFWQIESIRLSDHGFLVLGYRNPRKLETLVGRAPGGLRAVDQKLAYAKIGEDRSAPALYGILKNLLQLNVESTTSPA